MSSVIRWCSSEFRCVLQPAAILRMRVARQICVTHPSDKNKLGLYQLLRMRVTN